MSADNIFFGTSSIANGETTISAANILANMEKIKRELGPPPKQVYFSPYCTEPTDERLFPESRHRSARIKKKLIKRFGGEYVRKPCAYETVDKIFAHPSLARHFQNRSIF